MYHRNEHPMQEHPLIAGKAVTAATPTTPIAKALTSSEWVGELEAALGRIEREHECCGPDEYCAVCDALSDVAHIDLTTRSGDGSPTVQDQRPSARE